MNLSKRLEAVAGLVSRGNRLADIGTDHGYIPIYLIEKGIIDEAVAMDINKGPLKKAEDNVSAHGLQERIKLRLSDGLEKLNKNEVDTVLIAGMGGALMSRILNDGKAVLSTVSELILQPQSEICEFRHFLHNSGYKIVKEQMLIDDGKYYVMFKAVKGQERYASEVEYIYGHLLLKEKNPVLCQYIKKELHTYESILGHLASSDSLNAHKRREVLAEKIAYGKEALKYYDVQGID